MCKYSITCFLVILNGLWLHLFPQTTISVPPQGPNPSIKPGWKLIFNDEFDQLSLRNWDLSNSSAAQSWNPGHFGDDTPCCHEARISFEEPRQVTANNGRCVISLQEADAQSLCLGFATCTPLNEPCRYGRTGEIKTFSYESDAQNFRQWLIPEGSFVELRAKVGDKNCNAWSAFWLYGGEQEIDVFETLYQSSNENFDAGYWSEKYVDGEWIQIYDSLNNDKIVSRGFRVVRENIIEVVSIDRKGPVRYDDEGNIITTKVIKTIQISDVDLSGEFINYGVEFTSGNMKFFINGVKYFDWNLDQAENSHTDLPIVRPKAIRIGMGLHRNNCVFCPTAMENDYIRVYTPQSNRYVRWLQIPEIMNSNESKSIETNFLPSINYSWTFGNFSGIFTDNDKRSIAQISCPIGIQSGILHSVSLTSTFPDQSSEILTGQIYVQGNEAPRMPTLVKSNTVCLGGNNIRFEATVKGLYSNSLCSNNTGTYQWSIDGGVNYTNGGHTNSFILPNVENNNIRVRISNCFGNSAPISFEVPQLNCTDPRNSTLEKNIGVIYELYTINGLKIGRLSTIDHLINLNINPGIYLLKSDTYHNGVLKKSVFKKHIINN